MPCVPALVRWKSTPETSNGNRCSRRRVVGPDSPRGSQPCATLKKPSSVIGALGQFGQEPKGSASRFWSPHQAAGPAERDNNIVPNMPEELGLRSLRGCGRFRTLRLRTSSRHLHQVQPVPQWHRCGPGGTLSLFLIECPSRSPNISQFLGQTRNRRSFNEKYFCVQKTVTELYLKYWFF